MGARTTGEALRSRQRNAALVQRRTQTWEVCQDAAFDLIEFPGPENSERLNDQLKSAARRVCLCFEQQMLANDDRKVPRTSRRILARVLTEADL